MNKFVEVTGFRGDKITVNVAHVESVGDFIPQPGFEQQAADNYPNDKAILTTNTGQIILSETREEVVNLFNSAQ